MERSPEVSSRNAQQYTGDLLSGAQRYFRQKLRDFPYKLQMESQLSDQDKQGRTQSAEFFFSNLLNDTECLNKPFYFHEYHFFFYCGVHKPNC